MTDRPPMCQRWYENPGAGTEGGVIVGQTNTGSNMLIRHLSSSPRRWPSSSRLKGPCVVESKVAKLEKDHKEGTTRVILVASHCPKCRSFVMFSVKVLPTTE